MGGFCSAHGLACSNWAANRKSVASSPKRPANWTPIGMLSSFQYKGTDMAGCPVIFWVRVKAKKESAILIQLYCFLN
jgi:hypothetical protein